MRSCIRGRPWHAKLHPDKPFRSLRLITKHPFSFRSLRLTTSYPTSSAQMFCDHYTNPHFLQFFWYFLFSILTTISNPISSGHFLHVMITSTCVYKMTLA